MATRAHTEGIRRSSPFWSLGTMRDELVHALHEALYELDLLPTDDAAALLALYAVMDDLDQAIRRTQNLDPMNAGSGSRPGSRTGLAV